MTSALSASTACAKPLLELGSANADSSAAKYLARVATTYTGGTESLSYREVRRNLEHLAAELGGPRPTPRWPAGLPKFRVDLSRIQWSRITPEIATALRDRAYARVASGPRRHVRERVGKGPGSMSDPTKRPVSVRPAGHAAARARIAALRGVLRAAFESGAMPAARYLAAYEALRGF